MSLLIKSTLTVMVTFAMNSLAFAADVSGLIMVVKGDIKVTSKDGKTEAAKVGKKVSQGDTIIAGADARAKIVMSDKNVINVSPDTKIVIEKYENDGKDKKNVELNVLYGKVRAGVEQKYDGDKSKFNIKTPSAVAGVRGTDFIAGYSPATKVAQVITFSGTVAVGQPGPGGSIQNAVYVQPGQMTQAGAGQKPEQPKALPKEELNKLNSESSADTASTGKKESSDKKGDKDKDKEDKKDDKDKKDEKSDEKSDKKEDKKDEKDKKDDAKDDKKSDKKDEAQDDKKSEKSDKKDESKEDKKADKKEEMKEDKKSADKKDEPKDEPKSAKKDDSSNGQDQKQEAKQEQKQDNKKEARQEQRNEPKNDGPTKSDGGTGPGNAKNDGPNNSGPRDPANNAGPGPANGGGRSPSSDAPPAMSPSAGGGMPTRAPSMIDSRDLGPSVAKDVGVKLPTMPTVAVPLPPPIPAPIKNPILDTVNRTPTRSRTTIILSPQ